MPRLQCKNCGNIRTIQGRGLCKKCWENVEIRNRHSFGGSKRSYNRTPDENIAEEELNRLIEVQRNNLPDWWDKENRDI